jgi:RNA polymerase sigma-70 factor (ECF subfamily)
MKELVDRLYRESAGALTASLTRLLGPAHLDRVESLVHDAFAAAMEAWPASGPPDNPVGWLMTVARRRAIDELRRMQRARAREGDDEVEDAPAEPAPAGAPGPHLRGELADDLLRMMFVACHPSLSLESQVALTLRALCGTAVENLARALLVDAAAMEKRLVRARQTLRAEQVTFDLPPPAELAARTDGVLRALYVLFSEGYSARAGSEPIRAELCHEAIRLVELLLAEPGPLARAPSVHALAALMLLLAARLPARVDAAGELLLLSEQDRARWDGALIARGLVHLAASAEGKELSEYHLEAGIAACHALAPTCAATDWPRIVGYYDRLLELNPSPVIRLNRAIAVGYAEGPEQGLDELARLEREPRLEEYGLLRAARADLHARLGDTPRARAAYQRAIELAATEPQRRLLRRRLAELA